MLAPLLFVVRVSQALSGVNEIKGPKTSTAACPLLPAAPRMSELGCQIDSP